MPLFKFFQSVMSNNDDLFFHPHPFTKAAANHIANYSGKDLYYALIIQKNIVGYGMLRGWDEGYEIPSLALVIHPEQRRKGLSMKLISFLHEKAKQAGVKRIRLKVYRNNVAAINLYTKIGYQLSGEEDGQFVGYLDLQQGKESLR